MIEASVLFIMTCSKSKYKTFISNLVSFLAILHNKMFHSKEQLFSTPVVCFLSWILVHWDNPEPLVDSATGVDRCTCECSVQHHLLHPGRAEHRQRAHRRICFPGGRLFVKLHVG